MQTTVYFVRHAPADFSLENYHERKLSEKGFESVIGVTNALKNITVDHFISSSSPRAIETIRPLAELNKKEIETFAELQELVLRGKEVVLQPDEIDIEIKKVLEIPNYKLPGGDSRKEIEERGVKKFEELLNRYEGKTIVLGTHGIIMTLILAVYDSNFGFDFWKKTSKPDIYQVIFENRKIISTTRIGCV